MKIKLLLPICLSISLLMSGCQGTNISNSREPQEKQTTSAPTANAPTATLSSSEDAAMTSTPLATFEPTITVSPTPNNVDQELKTIKSDVLPEVPQQTDLTGVIVAGISDKTASFISDIYLMDAKSGEKISELPPNAPLYTSVSGFSVSPNGKLAAYYSGSNAPKDLYIINNKGEVLLDLPIVDDEGKYLLDNLIPGEVYWTGTTYWLDDESLITEKWPWDMSEWGPISAIYFKPFSGTARELLRVYPNISTEYNLYLSWMNGGLSIMAFDPSMTRLLYLDNDSHVVLYDLEKNIVISQYSYPEVINEGGPVWSTDGSRFLINVKEESTSDQTDSMDIYEISRDGEMKRLTYLNPLIGDYTLRNLTWSPDEKKIAFLFDSDQTPCGVSHNAPYLGVFDYDSPDTVKLYCYETYRFFRPIWSPDSRQILLETRDLQDYTLFPMLLIDTEEDYVAVMNKNLLPVGWMASE